MKKLITKYLEEGNEGWVWNEGDRILTEGERKSLNY